MAALLPEFMSSQRDSSVSASGNWKERPMIAMSGPISLPSTELGEFRSDEESSGLVFM